jgi:hypothetical protein
MTALRWQAVDMVSSRDATPQASMTRSVRRDCFPSILDVWSQVVDVSNFTG